MYQEALTAITALLADGRKSHTEIETALKAAHSYHLLAQLPRLVANREVYAVTVAVPNGQPAVYYSLPEGV